MIVQKGSKLFEMEQSAKWSTMTYQFEIVQYSTKGSKLLFWYKIMYKTVYNESLEIIIFLLEFYKV